MTRTGFVLGLWTILGLLMILGSLAPSADGAIPSPTDGMVQGAGNIAATDAADKVVGSGDGRIHIIPSLSAHSVKNGGKLSIQAVVKALNGVAKVEARIERDDGNGVGDLLRKVCSSDDHIVDNLLGLPVATFELKGAPVNLGGVNVGATMGMWQAEWEASDLTEGYYRVVVTVTDRAGHNYTDASLVFSDPIAGKNTVGTTAYPVPLRLDAANLYSGDPDLASAVIDVGNGLAYFGTGTNPGRVVKVVLGTGSNSPTWIGDVTLNLGEDNLVSAVIDVGNGFAYFGTNTSPGRVVKVDVNPARTFQRIGAVTLNTGENALTSAVIDAVNGYAYLGTNTSPGVVVKVALGAGSSPPTRIGALTLSTGRNSLQSAVIDAPNSYAYFGTYTSPGIVVKVALGSGSNLPTEVGAVQLSSGENSLSAAVIDTTNACAYFGTSTNPGTVVKVALGVGTNWPTRIGSVTLNGGEVGLRSAVIDAENGYAYWGTDTNPGIVVKVALGTGSNPPTRSGAVTLGVLHKYLSSTVIDAGSGYAYFGTYTNDQGQMILDPGIVVKVALGAGSSLPTEVGAAAFPHGEIPQSEIIDTTNGYVYIGTNSTPGSVVKVATGSGANPPTLTGVLTLNPDENYLSSAVIDVANGFAYFGTYTSPGIVVKVALGSGSAPPTEVGSLTLNLGENGLSSAVIDTTNGYAYFGTSTSPGIVVKVALGSGSDLPTEVGSLMLNQGEDALVGGVIDTMNGYAYFGAYASVGSVVKVALGLGANPPTRVGALILNSGEIVTCGVIDVASGYAYFGGVSGSGFDSHPTVVKVSLGMGTNPPARIGAVSINVLSEFGSAAIDSQNGYAYFGSAGLTPSVLPIATGNYLARVKLGAGASLPTMTGSLTLPSEELNVNCATINPADGCLYLGTSCPDVARVAFAENGFLKGTKFSMPQKGYATSVSFYSHAATGNVRLALYDNNSPQNLLWQSEAIANTVANGWLTVPISAGSPSTLSFSSSGTYWLCWQVDTSISVPSYASGSSSTGFYVPITLGSCPATITPTLTSENWSEYISYIALPVAPTSPASTAVGLNTITWTWTDNSGDETGFQVYDDPGAGPPVDLQAVLDVTPRSWQHNGLTVNSQYAFQVAATNIVGTGPKTSNYRVYTLVEPVSGLGFSGITTTGMSVVSTSTPSNLTSGSSGLYYANTTKGTNSGWVQNTTPWASTSLSANMLYAFSGKSRNGGSVETTPVTASRYTLIEPVSSLAFSNLTTTGISVASSSTPSNLSSGTSGLYFGNTTSGTNSGWQQNNTPWPSSGLSVNTQYAFTGTSRNGESVETMPATGASWTLIEPVLGLVLSSITASDITVSSNNTPSNLSSGSSGLYFANTTSGTNSGWQQTTAPWTSSSLLPNTQYTFSGKSRNGGSVETSPVMATAWTLIQPVSGLTFSSVTMTDISVAASNVPNNLTSGSSGLYFTNTTMGTNSGWQQLNLWPSTSLSPNTQYVFGGKSRNGAAVETAPLTDSKYTLIESVSTLAFTNITTTAISVSSTNIPSNLSSGASGLYFSNTTQGTNSGWQQTNTPWTSASLSANMRYTFSGKSRNAESVETTAASGAAYTQIERVSSLTFSNVTATSISVSSSNTPSNLSSGSSGLYFANTTMADDSGWVQSNTPWSSNGLFPNTQYSFIGMSRNGDTLSTTPASGMKYTLAAVPVAPLVSVPSTHITAVRALDVSISAADGNPVDTTYAIQVSPAMGGNSWVQADGTLGTTAVYQTAPVWGAKRVTGLARATSYTFTATARNGEGVSTASSPETTVSTLDNQAPTTPSVSLPSVLGDLGNLVCLVTTPGTDPDGDTVNYAYDWYVKHSGFPSFNLFRHDAASVATSSIVNNLDTAVGDQWYCVVTPTDGDLTGAGATTGTCTIVSGGPTPSSISVSVVPPSTVTLGQAVRLSGQITPPPAGSPTVTFHSVSPGGIPRDPYPDFTSCSGGNYTKTFYPKEASQDRLPWSVRSSWDGDGTYMTATSGAVTYQVNRATPTLGLALSHSSALLNLGGVSNFQVNATFSVLNWPSDPDLVALLSGRTIRLVVMTPGGETPLPAFEVQTDANGIATFPAAQLTGASWIDPETHNARHLFDQAGRYKFQAEFVQDANFNTARTDDWALTSAILTVKQGAGYAIIALGQLDQSAEGRANHLQTTDYVRSVLLERGFIADDIYYLRDQADPASAKRPTPANLEYAVKTWAAFNMNESPAPLYVVLVNHGGPGVFYMATPGVNGQVTAGDLGSWLNFLQSQLSPSNGASDQDIFVIDGSCYSGSMVPVLSGAHRVVVSSASADEIAYRGVENTETGLRDGDFFVMEFFRNLGTGAFVRDAFEVASTKTFEYTLYRSGGSATVPQHPVLDDNGDGAGTSAPLPIAQNADGLKTAVMTLGLGSNAGNGIGWFTVSPPKTIDQGGSIGTLVAETTGRTWDALNDEAWIEIKTPNYVSTVASSQYPQYQRVAQMAGPVPAPTPESLGGGKYRFTWSQADLAPAYLTGGFDTSGTYKVYYFLRDGQTHQVSAYLVTNIYVSKSTGNHAPSAVTRLYPNSGFVVPPGVTLAWTESIDEDIDPVTHEHEPVTYRVEISLDAGFPPASTIVTEVSETLLCTSDIAGLVTGNTYYWRVTPYDPYGAHPLQDVGWPFTLQGNPQNIGSIDGQAYIKGAQCTQFPVASPSVTLYDNLGVPVSFGTGDLGTPFMRQTGNRYILGNLPQADNYRLGVTATGFHAATVTGVIVASKLTTRQDACLQPMTTGTCSIAGPASVRVGQQVVLEFHADGMSAEWQYEWFHDGELLQGETGPTLTIASAALGNQGEYSCTALDQDGGVYSDSHHLDIMEYSLAGPGLVLLGLLCVLVTLHAARRLRRA